MWKATKKQKKGISNEYGKYEISKDRIKELTEFNGITVLKLDKEFMIFIHGKMEVITNPENRHHKSNIKDLDDLKKMQEILYKLHVRDGIREERKNLEPKSYLRTLASKASDAKSAWGKWDKGTIESMKEEHKKRQKIAYKRDDGAFDYYIGNPLEHVFSNGLYKTLKSHPAFLANFAGALFDAGAITSNTAKILFYQAFSLMPGAETKKEKIEELMNRIGVEKKSLYMNACDTIENLSEAVISDAFIVATVATAGMLPASVSTALQSSGIPLFNLIDSKAAPAYLETARQLEIPKSLAFAFVSFINYTAGATAAELSKNVAKGAYNAVKYVADNVYEGAKHATKAFSKNNKGRST